jgi:hypothetical protein
LVAVCAYEIAAAKKPWALLGYWNTGDFNFHFFFPFGSCRPVPQLVQGHEGLLAYP